MSSKMKAAVEKAGDELVEAAAEAVVDVAKDAMKEGVGAVKEIVKEAIEDGKEIAVAAMEEGKEAVVDAIKGDEVLPAVEVVPVVKQSLDMDTGVISDSAQDSGELPVATEGIAPGAATDPITENMS
jgi:hypothetical protein